MERRQRRKGRSNIENILTVVKDASIIVEGFAPGLLFFAIIGVITGATFQNAFFKTMAVISVSFIARATASHFLGGKLSDVSVLLVSCVGLIILSVVVCAIYSSNFFKEVMSRLFVKGVSDNLWEVEIDYRSNPRVTLFLKEDDCAVCGVISSIEEKGNDSWIALKKFAIISDGGNNEVIDEDETSTAMYRMADVKYAIITPQPTNKKDDKQKE